MSGLMYTQASGNRNFRKRRQDQAIQNQSSTGYLVDDKLLPSSVANNVAESTKVKQYLNRLSTADEKISSCIKIILCDSEAAELSSEELEVLQKDFEVESIYISECNPLSVDRILTLHGYLDCILRCAIYISFLVRSKANNILKIEPFTLKSQNYWIDALLETDDLSIAKLRNKLPENSLDICQYEKNSGLKLARFTGDFSSMFKSLTITFKSLNYRAYKSDEDIDILRIINVQDSESLHPRLEKEQQKFHENNSKILSFVYKNLEVS